MFFGLRYQDCTERAAEASKRCAVSLSDAGWDPLRVTRIVDGPKGSILRWLEARSRRDWGDDPHQFVPARAMHTLGLVDRFFGPGRYFGLEVTGAENIPDAPAMIVSNHSGGTSIPDVWGFGVWWYRRFGFERPLHAMAHEMIFSNRFTGRFFAERGVLHGSRSMAARVLGEMKRDIMVMPGGDLDTWRPYSERFQVRFGGRTGYARVALALGVPIVPVANAGAHETLMVLTDGRRLARALGLQKLARAEIFPIHLSLPWGLAVGPWPHIPMPARLRYAIGAPIHPPADWVAGSEPTDEAVRALDQRVRDAVQALLDELKSAG